MDRIDHQLECGIYDCSSFFPVESLISSIEPLLWANSAVTVLRSRSGSAELACSAEIIISEVIDEYASDRELVLAISAVSQSPQNSIPAGLSLPHFAQRINSPFVPSLREFSSPALPHAFTVQSFTRT
jgi:hypothetical protein